MIALFSHASSFCVPHYTTTKLESVVLRLIQILKRLHEGGHEIKYLESTF